MMDLATYTPMGDKKNSDFFEEYLPKVYERRAAVRAGRDRRQHGGVVVQVEHGDAINYLAELAVMGPYRLQSARLTDTHKVYVLQSQPEFPRLIVLEPLTRDLRGRHDPLEHALPARPEQAERALHRRGLPGASRRRRCARRSSRRTSASSTPATRSARFYALDAPDVHVPLRLHLQPGRLRRRRPRRPRRARPRRGDQPDRRRAGQARPAPTRSQERARHQGPGARRRPRGHPDPGRRPRGRAARVPDDGARTTSGAPTTSTR